MHQLHGQFKDIAEVKHLVHQPSSDKVVETGK
jgi:hypothetical protein